MNYFLKQIDLRRTIDGVITQLHSFRALRRGMSHDAPLSVLCKRLAGQLAKDLENARDLAHEIASGGELLHFGDSRPMTVEELAETLGLPFVPDAP